MTRIGAGTGFVLGSAGGLAIAVGAGGVAIIGLALLWSFRPAAPTDPAGGAAALQAAVATATPALAPCLALIPEAERGNNRVVLRVDVVDAHVALAWVESRTLIVPKAADCLADQVAKLATPGCPDMALRLPFDLP